VNESTDLRRDLPNGERSGEDATWVLPTSSVEDDLVVDGVLTLDARFLGVGSSRKRRHMYHTGTAFAPKETRCGVCRWFETRIFRVGGNEYVLYHVGRSIVPGERDYARHERAYSPAEVIELYTVRKRDEKPFLTGPARLALAQAEAHDAELSEVYRNRSGLITDSYYVESSEDVRDD